MFKKSPFSNKPKKKKSSLDLVGDVIDDQWNSVLDFVHTLSFHSKHAFVQEKVVYRVHFTNATLGRTLSHVVLSVEASTLNV